ncbi:adenylate/guanylate cyclase domain-containing protein [Humidesulfovibrio idahonensis]
MTDPEAPPPPKSHHSVVRLRTVIILFFSCVLALTEAVTWLYYQQSITSAREEAGKHILAAGDKIELSARLLTKPLAMLCDAAPTLPGAGVKPRGFAHPLLGYMLAFLDTHPETYSLYFGYGDGDYFQAISLTHRPKTAQGLMAPPQTRYALRRIGSEGGARVERWRFLDRDAKPLRTSAARPAGYDPRGRPWYTAALGSASSIKTDLYVFSSTGALGLTMAHRVPGPGRAVFGLDLTLDTLSYFLAQAKIGASGFIFLFNGDGELIAYPDADKVSKIAATRGGSQTVLRAAVQDLDDPLPPAVYKLFRSNGGHIRETSRLVVAGTPYLVGVRPLRELGSNNDHMALVARESDFMGTAERIRTQAILFALGLLILGVPLLLLVSANIARTLAKLTYEAERISKLEMDSTEIITSHIDEVDRLGDAVARMRSALLSSCRYLPQSLVRQFIKEGTVPSLGGKRHDITLLFTDVQNFTTLSEGMPPEDLMAAMSEYFEIVGQAILKSGGTIDKFIGDSVMAFWNAPLTTENHVESACLAALRLSLASQELNARREASGGPVMATRVGIHTGTAIVGNVGASDRMSYTALGPVVNLASRLEGLNKFYATKILVSHDVRDKARHNFLFRSVDVVVPKGVKEPLPIFELIGSMPQSPYADVAAPRARLGFCSRWERAMTLYRTVQWEKALEEFTALHEAAPGDFVAAMYLQRVRRLLQNKPSKDWKAVQKFMHK